MSCAPSSQPSSAGRSKVVGLAQGVERAPELVGADECGRLEQERLGQSNPADAGAEGEDRRFALVGPERRARRDPEEVGVPDMGGRFDLGPAGALGAEGARQPPCAFGEVAVEEPQPGEVRRHRERRVGLAAGEVPVECHLEIGEIAGQAVPPCRRRRAV